MRILILTNDGEGIYKFRKEVVQALSKDNDVFVSLPKDNYKDKIISLGCEYIETEFNRKGTNPFKDIKLIKTYVELIKRIKPDMVLTYTIKPNVYGGFACQLMKVPYAMNITGGLGSTKNDNALLELIADILYVIGGRKAYKVFFQNKANMEYMTSRGVINKTAGILIPGSGVNLNEYKVLPFHEGDTIDFVYIGRMMAAKGFNQYIEAAQIIKEKHPEAVFHIAGIYEDDYKNIVEELTSKGIVNYHGSVVDMVNVIYKNVECIVHPTYYAEGLSNVLLEASASGRAIITTNRPGSGEVIDDGINGYIVKEKDSNDLVKQLEKYISLSVEERKQMGLNGRKKVEKEFNREIVVNKYLEVVNSLKK